MKFHKNDKVELSKEGKKLFSTSRCYKPIIPRSEGIVYSEPKTEIVSVQWTNLKSRDYLHQDFLRLSTLCEESDKT